jgi:hypothetical protein
LTWPEDRRPQRRLASVFRPAATRICPRARLHCASPGGVVQLVRTPACHAGGRGFESRRSRSYPSLAEPSDSTLATARGNRGHRAGVAFCHGQMLDGCDHGRARYRGIQCSARAPTRSHRELRDAIGRIVPWRVYELPQPGRRAARHDRCARNSCILIVLPRTEVPAPSEGRTSRHARTLRKHAQRSRARLRTVAAGRRRRRCGASRRHVHRVPERRIGQRGGREASHLLVGWRAGEITSMRPAQRLGGRLLITTTRGHSSRRRPLPLSGARRPARIRPLRGDTVLACPLRLG